MQSAKGGHRAFARLLENAMGHEMLICCGYVQQIRDDVLYDVTFGFLMNRLESQFPPQMTRPYCSEGFV